LNVVIPSRSGCVVCIAGHWTTTSYTYTC